MKNYFHIHWLTHKQREVVVDHYHYRDEKIIYTTARYKCSCGKESEIFHQQTTDLDSGWWELSHQDHDPQEHWLIFAFHAIKIGDRIHSHKVGEDCEPVSPEDHEMLINMSDEGFMLNLLYRRARIQKEKIDHEEVAQEQVREVDQGGRG